MPYYVFKVGALGVLTKLAEFDAFRAASVHAKTVRAQIAADGGGRVKVMFAGNQLAAEDLLSQVREPGPAIGDDD
jgi:hypothetical protein